MALRLERMVTMDALIRAGTYPSIRTFTQRFEVSERTVHGDLSFLRQRLEVPLAYDRQHKGYYYTNLTWLLPTIFATEGELLAFFLSVELARRYLGTTFEEPLRTATALLSHSLPDEVQLDLSLLAQHSSFQTGATACADPSTFLALSEAIQERWPMEMTYFTASRGDRNRRIIEPYHMYNVRGEWQVIAFDHLRRAFRNFAVSRIEDWTLLKTERLTRDPAFSSPAYLAQGFLAERGDTSSEVVIWFDEYQARYIRGKQWHPSQQIEEHDDSSLTLSFETGALAEVRRWCMSYGSYLRIISPPELIGEIVKEAQAMLNHHTPITS